MPSSRPQSHAGPRSRVLPLTVFALCILAILPVRFLNPWLKPLGGLTYRVIAPISHPISEASRWVAPGRIDELSDEPEQVLRMELERTRQAMLREKAENDRLRAVIEDLQRGIALGTGSAVRPLTTSVIGNPSDLSSGMLVIRAGSSKGVTTNGTVATYQGIQLVGRVERVMGATSYIRPITAKRAGRLDGLVMLVPDGSYSLACSLTPTGEGTLRGPVTEPDSPNAEHQLELGQDVRLNATDGSWPDNAQMLLIGRVINIEPAPGQSLRRWVTVQPLADLRSVSQVVLRIPLDEHAEDQP